MADQYRKLGQFYDSSSLLVAAGDDFAYSGQEDLPYLYKVYKALFSYINQNEKYNMTVSSPCLNALLIFVCGRFQKIYDNIAFNTRQQKRILNFMLSAVIHSLFQL